MCLSQGRIVKHERVGSLTEESVHPQGHSRVQHQGSSILGGVGSLCCRGCAACSAMKKGCSASSCPWTENLPERLLQVRGPPRSQPLQSQGDRSGGAWQDHRMLLSGATSWPAMTSSTVGLCGLPSKPSGIRGDCALSILIIDMVGTYPSYGSNTVVRSESGHRTEIRKR